MVVVSKLQCSIFIQISKSGSVNLVAIASCDLNSPNSIGVWGERESKKSWGLTKSFRPSGSTLLMAAFGIYVAYNEGQKTVRGSVFKFSP